MESTLDKLPSRIKYYLLDWKDKNMDEYLKAYGEISLNDLPADKLSVLFKYVTSLDGDLINGGVEILPENCIRLVYKTVNSTTTTVSLNDDLIGHINEGGNQWFYYKPLNDFPSDGFPTIDACKEFILNIHPQILV